MTWYLNKPCLHDSRAVCALCSDQDPRWREWRNGAEPPNAPARLRKLQAENMTGKVA